MLQVAVAIIEGAQGLDDDVAFIRIFARSDLGPDPVRHVVGQGDDELVPVRQWASPSGKRIRPASDLRNDTRGRKRK